MARNPNRSRRRRRSSDDDAATPAPRRRDEPVEPEPEIEPDPIDEELDANGVAPAADEAEHLPASAGGGRGGAILFLRNCAEELRRVQWPDRRQVGQATAVVLGFCLIAGGFLGAMDALWKPVVEAIL